MNTEAWASARLEHWFRPHLRSQAQSAQVRARFELAVHVRSAWSPELLRCRPRTLLHKERRAYILHDCRAQGDRCCSEDLV
eukprot:6172846-Pleurochrysis_carterae.AAC.2